MEIVTLYYLVVLRGDGTGLVTATRGEVVRILQVTMADILEISLAAKEMSLLQTQGRES